MGKVKAALLPEWEIQQRIKREREETEYFAVPESLQRNLEISQQLKNSQASLRQQNAELGAHVKELSVALGDATSWQSRWKERVIGFLLGCLASIAASFV